MSDCYFQPVTGLNPETIDQMVQGPGRYYYNVLRSALDDDQSTDPLGDAIADAFKGGATRGGSAFAEELDIRDVEVDGVQGPTVGLQAMNTRMATITVRPLEHSIANYKAALSATDITDVGNGLTRYQPRICMNPGDYLANVLVTARKGAGSWVLFLLENARATDGLNLDLPNNDEAVPEISFQSHYDFNSPTTVPYAVYAFNTVPDFLISIDTTTPLTVAQGATLDITINITRILSYAQSITSAVLVKGGAGLTGSAWTENVTAPSADGTLTITAAADATIGKSYLHINARGADGKVATAVAPITVTA